MKNKRKYLNLLLVLLIFLTGCKKTVEPQERTEFMMDTIMNLKIYDGENNQAMDQAFERLKEIEGLMSAHIDDSDLSKINKNAGKKPVEVDPELYMIIEKAIEIADRSNGAYEPTIGPLVDLWDIKEGGSNRKALPREEDILEAKNKVDYKKLELSHGNKVFLQEEGMKMDLGGIVKGYAADQVKEIFEKNGVESAIIDLGGNIYVMGKKPDSSKWNIGIRNPLDDSGAYLGILKMANETIVTSGDYERYFDFEGERYHHIIDWKTGYPSKSDLSGVAIISDNSMEADALSTAVFVLGKEEGKKLLETYPKVEGIYIGKDKTIVLDKNLEDSFELKSDIFKVK